MTNQTTVLLTVHIIPDANTYFANLNDGRQHYVIPLTEGEAEEMARAFDITIRSIISSPLPELPFDGSTTTQA